MIQTPTKYNEDQIEEHCHLEPISEDSAQQTPKEHAFRPEPEIQGVCLALPLTDEKEDHHINILSHFNSDV